MYYIYYNFYYQILGLSHMTPVIPTPHYLPHMTPVLLPPPHTPHMQTRTPNYNMPALPADPAGWAKMAQEWAHKRKRNSPRPHNISRNLN